MSAFIPAWFNACTPVDCTFWRLSSHSSEPVLSHRVSSRGPGGGCEFLDLDLGTGDGRMRETAFGTGTALAVQDLGNQKDLPTGAAADGGVVPVPVFLKREVVLVKRPHPPIVGQADPEHST